MNSMLANVAAEVARNLASIEMIEASAFISTPLVYPGGGTVVVRLDHVGDRYFLSDAGMGRREAEFLGGERIFARLAPNIAARFGVGFDHHAFFVADTSREDLVPAVVAISNASRSAVELTAYRVAEKAATGARELMREKLISAFGQKAVATSYKLRGASNDEWDFDAAVTTDDHLALFQVVTPATQSVYGAVARFTDIADLPQTDGRPRLVAVLEDPLKTPRLRLVERSAYTIDLAAGLTSWQKVAA
jgi:hypothetical protein